MRVDNRVRSAEYKAKKSARAKEQRRLAREAAGKPSRAEVIAAAAARREQKAKVQPSVSRASIKRDEMVRRLELAVRRSSGPAETVDEFLARGGQVERVPGYIGPNFAAGLPARQSMPSGARGA